MTTLTTILGMLPMCFTIKGQSAMVQPIGVAVVGGLTSSTFVTLLVIPVLYSLVMRKKPKKTRLQKVLEGSAEETELYASETLSDTKTEQKTKKSKRTAGKPKEPKNE